MQRAIRYQPFGDTLAVFEIVQGDNQLTVAVGGQIAALKRIAGDKVAARIRRAPDALVERIVAGWPSRFDPKRALGLGFEVEATFDDIIRAHIEDELGGKIA